MGGQFLCCPPTLKSGGTRPPPRPPPIVARACTSTQSYFSSNFRNQSDSTSQYIIMIIIYQGLIVLILSTVNYHDYTPSVGISNVGRRTEKVEGSSLMCLLPVEFVFWGVVIFLTTLWYTLSKCFFLCSIYLDLADLYLQMERLSTDGCLSVGAFICCT